MTFLLSEQQNKDELTIIKQPIVVIKQFMVSYRSSNNTILQW